MTPDDELADIYDDPVEVVVDGDRYLAPKRIVDAFESNQVEVTDTAPFDDSDRVDQQGPLDLS